ncbi:glycosyltransferase family 4 protein [Methylosinus sp. Ce-a6]|uniref:glycosyltransferase family 4 protein n=1 Tax=Methylosinus sp. Ce-a6 TaxID=2172005 RepID=UPI0013569B32|nr:glycosyltransferase family 4 protein [Methylosinus sp. Ce-a6]
MKIVLSTCGRFHMFALARELERRRFLEKIYSGFTWGALARERLPRERVGVFPLVRPFIMASGRLGVSLPRPLSEALHLVSLTTLDAYVRAVAPECDIFVGHEGAGLWSGAAAQRRGALYVCDRGCSHMGWKERLLEEEYDRIGLKYPGRPWSYQRELDEYERADLIVTPSDFAKSSFVASGFSAEKLAVVPYGVDLTTFSPVEEKRKKTFEALFVGALSVRKGAHDLLAAFESLDVADKRLTIAGSISSEIAAALGQRLQTANIRLLGTVSQTALKEIMGRSDALVLPSVEEGLALVQAEAMACGCPVVATTNTGASNIFTDGEEGFIVPIRSPQAIAEKLQLLAENRDLQHAMSQAAVEKMRSLGGWASYGAAMVAAYEDLTARRRSSRSTPSARASAFE